MGDELDLRYKCSICGWVGTEAEHAFSEHGYRRCPRCRERGVDLATDALFGPPSPLAYGYLEHGRFTYSPPERSSDGS